MQNHINASFQKGGIYSFFGVSGTQPGSGYLTPLTDGANVANVANAVKQADNR